MQIPNSPLAAKFRAKHRCDCVALVIANRNAVYVGTGGRTIGGFCLPDESPRDAVSRLAEELAGFNTRAHYLAWLGTREFPIKGAPTKVHLFLCHPHWTEEEGCLERRFKGFDEMEAEAQHEIRASCTCRSPAPTAKLPQWSLLDNSHLSSAKVQPVFKWLAEIINKPLPEVDLPWERTIPLQSAEQLMDRYNKTNE